MRNEILTPTKVVVGDDLVTLKRSGQSTVVVAKIIGRSRSDAADRETLWLDRYVHLPGEPFEGWIASGAISTILASA